ncbi:MAG: hypothetical protein K0Q97_2366, partial [Bacillota bacterium]|nr:hypothetical protein [Bacillota bacterium]
VAAPFVTNLALGTSGTPLNTATFVGASLLEIKDEELDSYYNRATVIGTITNLAVIAIGLIFGVIR